VSSQEQHCALEDHCKDIKALCAECLRSLRIQRAAQPDVEKAAKGVGNGHRHCACGQLLRAYVAKECERDDRGQVDEEEVQRERSAHFELEPELLWTGRESGPM